MEKFENCRSRDRERERERGPVRIDSADYLRLFGDRVSRKDQTFARQKFEETDGKVEFLLMDDVRSFQLSAGNYKSKMETSMKEEDRSMKIETRFLLSSIRTTKINVYSYLLSLISQKKKEIKIGEITWNEFRGAKGDLGDSQTLLTRFKTCLRIFRIVQNGE